MPDEKNRRAGSPTYIFPERDGDPADLKPLDQGQRDSLATAFRADYGQATSQRHLKDETLDYFNDMYEMNISSRNTPYANAPNVCVPLVQIIMRGIFSKVAASVFVPRLYTSTPLEDQAADASYSQENYYNAEWYRKKALKDHLETLGFSLRDSVSNLEILWEEQTVLQKIAVINQVTKKKEIKEVEVQEKKGVYYNSVEYRDLILSPATAKNPQVAETVYRRLYLSEQDLWDMVASGDMYEEEVERLTLMHAPGQTDLTSSTTGTATYRQGGTIQPGDTGATSGEDNLKARGIFEVFRVHTRAFLKDDNGRFEEVVAWYYDQLPAVLGVSSYKYWHRKRPFATCCPVPRWGRYEGFAIPELERSMQEEMNARHNQRGESMDLQTFPGLWQTANAELLTPNDPIGPNARWKVLSKDDVGIIDLGQPNPISFEEESILMSYALRVIGLESPSLPLYGGKQPTQQMQKSNQISTSVTLDMISAEVRQFCEEVLWQTHKLNIQYMDDEQKNELEGTGLETVVDGEKYTIPYEDLLAKTMLSVAGTQGALDKESRTQNVRVLYSMLMQNPLVQGNLERVWNATALLLEDANLPAFTKYIGNLKDAQDQQKQIQAAQQQAQQMQLQMAQTEHSKNPPPGQGQPPGQPPQGQPGPSQNGAAAMMGGGGLGGA